MDLPSMLSFRNPLEGLGKFSVPPLQLFQTADAVVAPLRLIHENALQAARASTGLLGFQEIAQANQQLFSAFDGIRIDSSPLLELGKVHSSWAESFRFAQEPLALQTAAKLSLASSLQIGAVTEKIYGGLNFSNIQSACNLTSESVLGIGKQVSDFSKSFGLLAESMGDLTQLTAMPSCVLPNVSREAFATCHALLELAPRQAPFPDPDIEQWVEQVEEQTSDCTALLAKIDPELARTYRGAREALEGHNVDRGRHALVSLRELCGHLLRRLAPDDEVIAWIPSHNEDLLHKGKPTRKARFLFVCRAAGGEPLAHFFERDAGIVSALFELFDRLHELKPGLDDFQLRALFLRVDSWLIFTLQIHKETTGASQFRRTT